MKGDWIVALLSCGMLLLAGCSAKAAPVEQQTKPQSMAAFTRESGIEDVQYDPAFGSFGRLLFPTTSYYYSGDTLEELALTYYSHIDPDETVEIVNTLYDRAEAGQTVFYDIYTEQEKEADPAKRDDMYPVFWTLSFEWMPP